VNWKGLQDVFTKNPGIKKACLAGMDNLLLAGQGRVLNPPLRKMIQPIRKADP
jgi:hypothetical protein